MFQPSKHVGRLRRLDDSAYRGLVSVHWTMTIEHRARGWLTSAHFQRVRELLCHTLGRYHLTCPAFVLMPDHGHFLWSGFSPRSDQSAAAAHFRRSWNRELATTNHTLQRQAYDHVLRRDETIRSAFENVVAYIFQNPMRAGLTNSPWQYPFHGAMIPGYPDFHPSETDYWDDYWRIFSKLAQAADEGP